MTLTWQDNCHNEEGYRLFFKRGEIALWDSLNLPENTEEYTDENVIPGIMNYYKICAYYENDTSGFIFNEIKTLPAPGNLTCTQQDVHTFELTWTDNSQFEQGFKIDRKIDEEEWVNNIHTTLPNATTWIDSTLGRSYNTVYYRLYAYYETYCSDNIETNSNITFPAPSNLAYEKITIYSIKLTWNDNSQGETGFKIDKKVGANDWQNDYATVSENIQEWTDENAEINENLMYKVYACCGNNVSDYATSQQIDNTFPAPTNLTYQKIDIGTIKLAWADKSVGEEGFKIDKKVGEEDWDLEYAIVNDNIEQWLDWTAEINKTIQYRVYAYYGNNVSDYVLTDEIDNSIPAPTNISFEKIDVHTIKLGWTDNSIGEQGFKIDKKVGENEWQTNFAIVDNNIEEWTDENAEINEFIKYRVYAYYASNLSDYATTNEIDNSLPAPTNFDYEIISPTSIQLTWNDNSIGEHGFKIDKKIGDGTWQNEYVIFDENTSEWVDENIDLINNYYFYRIYSYYYNYISSKSEIEIFNTFTKTFGGIYDDFGRSVSQTGDGGFIITGDTYSFSMGSSDIWLIKTDALGNEEWSRTFGGTSNECGLSASETNDGGFIIAGYTSSAGSGESDVWLIKADEIGNEEWNKTFGGSNTDGGRSVSQTNDGGFIITGSTSSYGLGNQNVWLIKTDILGNEEWNRTFGSSNAAGNSVYRTTDGGFIVTGDVILSGHDCSDVWLIKTDASGNEEWNKTYGGFYAEVGNSVSQTEEMGFIITGYTQSYGPGHWDVWLIKTDEFGTEEWNRTFGGSECDVGYSASQTDDGGFIVTGYIDHFGGSEEDLYLIKTDHEGNVE